jgi:hypothetical protein
MPVDVTFFTHNDLVDEIAHIRRAHRDPRNLNTRQVSLE